MSAFDEAIYQQRIDMLELQVEQLTKERDSWEARYLDVYRSRKVLRQLVDAAERERDEAERRANEEGETTEYTVAQYRKEREHSDAQAKTIRRLREMVNYRVKILEDAHDKTTNLDYTKARYDEALCVQEGVDEIIAALAAAADSGEPEHCSVCGCEMEFGVTHECPPGFQEPAASPPSQARDAELRVLEAALHYCQSIGNVSARLQFQTTRALAAAVHEWDDLVNAKPATRSTM
jgi:chromosome segregation ATPase